MIPWEERFRLDVWYVDNWSLNKFSKRAVLATLKMALKGQGVPDSTAANWEFLGTASNGQGGGAGTANAGPGPWSGRALMIAGTGRGLDRAHGWRGGRGWRKPWAIGQSQWLSLRGFVKG